MQNVQLERVFKEVMRRWALLRDVMEWGSGYGYGHDIGCN
jgi:hypothetical protein